MMATRRGMGKNMGKGYKNLMGKDPKVHSQSAKGIKQPQRLNELQTRIKALSKFKSPAFQEEKELLKKEYKELLNRDIDDYSIGIENIRVKKRMQEIEDTFRGNELSNISGWKNTSKTYSDGSKSLQWETKDKRISIDKDFEGKGWNIGVTSLRDDEPPQLMADTHNTKAEAYKKAKKYMEENNKEKTHNLTIEPTYVPRGSENNPNAGVRDLHYKIKEWGFVFPTKKDAEKYADEHILRNGIIKKR